MRSKYNFMEREIMVDGIKYVPESLQKVVNTDGLEYCIVRTYSAGVFAGYLKERNGMEGVVLNARRLWYWSGASSLSQLALEGVKNPDDCKFPVEIPEVTLTQIIEIIPASEEAKKSIDSVKIWEQ